MRVRKRPLIKVLLTFVIILPVLFAATWFFVSYQLSRLETYKELITKTLGKALKRDVTYTKAEASLTMLTGLNLQFTNVTIRDKDQSADLLNIPEAFFQVDILPLLRKQLIFRDINLHHPRLSLKRDRTGTLNIADLLTAGQKPGWNMEFQKITIDKGLMTFFDQAISREGLETSLTNLSCRVDAPLWDKKSHFHITAAVHEDKNQGELSLAGTFYRASSSIPFAQSTIEASLLLKGMDIHHYLLYLDKHAPLEQLAGRLDARTAFSGTLSDFSVKGNVTLNDALLECTRVFRDPLHPKKVHIDYALKRNPAQLQLAVTRLKIDEMEASGRLSLADINQADPLLSATVTTATFSRKEIQSYIPWGIIPENIGHFIEAHIPEGNFRLIEGKLNGRQSQIIQLERPENAGILALQAEVNKGVFLVNKTTPAFQDISGILELKNRQLLLKNMKGRFGASPCTLEGNISDFALPQPAVYTAAMTLQPARPEILWLFGKEKLQNLSFQGSSNLVLSGNGSVDDYRISAHWDLTNTKYAYPEIIEKPLGRQNRLATEITLNKKFLNVSSFNFDLPPVSVNGALIYNFDGKKPVSLRIDSKVFNIHEAVSILPLLRTYNPAGTCLISIAGSGDLNDPGSFQWQGNAALYNVSLQLAGNIQPVKGLTGKIFLRGSWMETSRFKATIGKSAVNGQCTVNDFRKPQIACQFAAPLFFAEDAGWHSPEGEVDFRDVKGNVAIAAKHIHVESLELLMGNSRLNLAGDIRDFTDPQITVSLNSPYINGADIARLMTLKSSERKNDYSPSPVAIDASVRVDAGTFQGVDFTNLQSRLNFAGKSVNIETSEVGFFGGKLTGKGKVDIFPDSQNKYTANLRLERIALDKLQGFLDMKDHLVTGDLSFTGDVTATGRNVDDCLKTAAGKFQVRAQKGVLKKFSVLSKIFSLLNVFQLAKLQLPDMAAGGMPYNTITGDLTLQEGVLSAEDFFLDSDAMQISAVGKVDLRQKELHNTVGVHPLHTLDKIVAKIPVAGWLVTDEKGNLITVHFQVEGKWDDPQVTAIPVQSVARGTLDIFRRFFQLPEKLITDTGEVILGK